MWKCKAGVKHKLAHLNKSLYELNSLPPCSSGVFVVQRPDLLWDFSEPRLQVLCKRQDLKGLKDSLSYKALISFKRLKYSQNNPWQSNKNIKHILFPSAKCWPFFPLTIFLHPGEGFDTREDLCQLHHSLWPLHFIVFPFDLLLWQHLLEHLEEGRETTHRYHTVAQRKNICIHKVKPQNLDF